MDLMLFDDSKYLDYKFPEPQYLGAKYIHRGWIARFAPDEITNVLDAFAGSQSIAYTFKQLGKKVITNDFLNCNNLIGKALIENSRYTLEKEDLDILFSPNSNPEEFNLMEKLFANLFFLPEEAAFVDSFRSNIRFLNNPYKEALALSVMCRSMTRKVTMGHFAHTQALVYAADPNRIKRNRSLIRPLKDIFRELLPDYNAAVFDNGKDNKSYNENILELLPQLNNIDLVYFDPPYCNSHADYQSFYHLLETYVEYWKDKQFVNGTKRYEPKRYSGFDKNKEAISNLQLMFERAKHIPTWLVSYNDRSYPDIDTMIEMIAPYRNVTVERKTYKNGRGGKGSVAGSSEILFVCTTK
ncbi:MAG: DNA adenine methylase [Candidatus Bacteroides intestinipullorum]|uniref:site-specific DNA-methyltransferase (adenine-specific) n=1 Tax=Candidatus Bacteroides intestinipullorum TaxID=2838471 RepID=A0A9E2KHS2_9BACE|nr:DNA adenine methylase [Candidatus Bacteroides intestinipullorum]